MLKKEKENETTLKYNPKYKVENLEGLIKVAVSDGIITVEDGFVLFRELIKLQEGKCDDKDIQDLREKIAEMDTEIATLKLKEPITIPTVPSEPHPWTTPWTAPGTVPYPWITWYNTNEIKAGDVVTKTYNGPFEYTTTYSCKCIDNEN